MGFDWEQMLDTDGAGLADAYEAAVGEAYDRETGRSPRRLPVDDLWRDPIEPELRQVTIVERDGSTRLSWVEVDRPVDPDDRDDDDV
jgi:hypothetical protein